MRTGRLRIGYVCALSLLFAVGCESDKTSDDSGDREQGNSSDVKADSEQSSSDVATTNMQDSVPKWEIAASASMGATLYVGGGPTCYNGYVRDTLLTLTFQSKQDGTIKGIHIAKVEVYYGDGTEVEEMPAAEFRLETSWDGSLRPRESVDATYHRLDQPASFYHDPPTTSEPINAGAFYFCAVVSIEEEGGISTVVTTPPTLSDGYSICYLALPPPGD